MAEKRYMVDGRPWNTIGTCPAPEHVGKFNWEPLPASQHRTISGQDLKSGDVFHIVGKRTMNTNRPVDMTDEEKARVHHTWDGGHMGNGGDPGVETLGSRYPFKMHGWSNTVKVVGKIKPYMPSAQELLTGKTSARTEPSPWGKDNPHPGHRF